MITIPCELTVGMNVETIPHFETSQPRIRGIVTSVAPSILFEGEYIVNVKSHNTGLIYTRLSGDIREIHSQAS